MIVLQIILRIMSFLNFPRNRRFVYVLIIVRATGTPAALTRSIMKEHQNKTHRSQLS